MKHIRNLVMITATVMASVVLGATVFFGDQAEEIQKKDSKYGEVLVGVGLTERGTEKETEDKTEDIDGIIEDPSEDRETENSSESETGNTEGNTKKNGFTVGIDPGHQGSWVDMSEKEPDGPGSENYKAKSSAGTTGRFTGVPEYELNLDISLALREELEKRGYEVIMTREDNDTAISNAERAQKVAAEGGDIYVRIHANGSEDLSVSGALGMTPSPDNPYIPQLAEESYRLTECILNAYCEATGFGNLGIQYYDNMTGINWSSVPVTILEMGFMTNEGDDYAMQEESMQKRMVQGIADGIDEYFEAYERKPEEKDSDTEGPASKIYDQYLKAREEMGEKWSVSLEDLKEQKVYQYRETEKMQSASVIKVFIMGTVYDRMCYPSSPKLLIPAQESYDGELRDLLEQMITVSDNDAANRLITMLGEGDFSRGAQVVNQFCEENGYDSTSVGRAFLEQNPAGDNYTSARDCRKLLSDIYQGTCVNKEASEKMLTILKGQTVTCKIPAGLPSGTVSANKTGEMPEGYGLGCIENDMAVVFSEKGDYVLTVLSNELGGRNEEAKQVITDISSFVWEWMENKKSEN